MAIPILPLQKLALFTDFDGTLVPIAPTPDAIERPPELFALIDLMYRKTGNATALITGRNLSDLYHLIQLPHIPAAGSHGAEWQFSEQRRECIDNVDHLFASIKPAISEFAAQHDLIVEDKRFSLAIHFRQAPHLEAAIDDFTQQLVKPESELKVIKGKLVREIKPLQVNKGMAIARFMKSSPFLGRTPYYFGDDTTDEDGFAWVNAAGGISVKVGDGKTAADYHLDNTDAVSEFFQTMLKG